MGREVIAIRGACEHNLKAVDLEIPRGALVVFTGVSGSGKSSLAFDTLYAEGQRRYVESLSAYARQFLGQLDKPKYTSIHGLSPTIAIEQKTSAANPRSTVGTVTEIYDHVRVLMARAGRQHCPGCGDEVGRQTPEQIADRVLSWPEGTRFMVMAPLARQRKGTFADTLDRVRRSGYVRVRVDGEIQELGELEALDKKRKHDLDVIIDRLSVQADVRERLVDSIETGLKEGVGVLSVLRLNPEEEVLFSARHYCAACDRSFPEPSPQLFSFNSPVGMCPTCNGLGVSLKVDPGKVVPDPSLSIDEGAIRPWQGEGSWVRDILATLCRHLDIARDVPWEALSEAHREVLLRGYGEPLKVTWDRSKGKGTYEARYEGVMNTLERRWRETESDAMRDAYQAYFSSAACPDCHGERLREEARHVRFQGETITALVARPIGALRLWIDGLSLEGRVARVAGELLKEIGDRLRFLDDVGVGYLQLSRSAATLSGGESQRIRLARQIGTELTGVLYVLDEPSIGLHPRDNRRLVDTLTRLRDIGNTVLVVEHDADTIRAADHVVDFGPGAGVRGGEVVAEGTPEAICADEASLTGAYLSGRRQVSVPRTRRSPLGWLVVLGAREHNLKDVDVRFPLGAFTVVTGVSGAGKSTLVEGILKPALARQLNRAERTPGLHRAVQGLAQLDKVIAIDQRPIGRTPRSNPATYTKVLDAIRKVLAQTREARMYGYQPGRFSFNVKGGRCDACKGDGVTRVEMHFLPDVYVTCEVCRGLRFNQATLRVRYKGHTISDILGMTVAEALVVFENHPRIHRILQTLSDVGLGYLALGQASTTLSGGEAQRVKLSRELARVQTGRTMYILDEPSTGLHFADVERLLEVIDRLVEAGNTVVMVEHHLDIIKAADHVIDLGPDGGDGGGRVVAAGTPEEVCQIDESYTGRFLREVLGS